MDSSKKINVSIIGATGYVGAELVRGFSSHPVFELRHLIGRSFAGQKFSDVYPEFRSVCDIVIEDLSPEEVAKDSDLVITALPHGVSSQQVPVLLNAGCKVIDHSGDFRYKDLATYEKSYKLEHPHPELLADAVYGLPEFYWISSKIQSLPQTRAAIRHARSSLSHLSSRTISSKRIRSSSTLSQVSAAQAENLTSLTHTANSMKASSLTAL